MPRALILYHYLYPDDVVSAALFSELSAGLAARGWEVEARACNRGCRHGDVTYPTNDVWKNVLLHRTWRPGFDQSRGIGRMLNAAWMIAAWGLIAFERSSKFDVLVVGTDPVLSVIVAPLWKAVRPDLRLVHWVHDLYPEAAVADGLINENGLFAKALRRLLAGAYKRCDLIADIGPCMRKRLSRYVSPAKRSTFTPWALEEPVQPLPIDYAERSAIFGRSKLALLYSGSLGRAHDLTEIFQLARAMRGVNAGFAFVMHGNRVEALRECLEPADSNIFFASFSPREQLASRLSAADVHIVTLKSKWTGTVVPSKFFAALAAGRPVLFAGSRESSVTQWILEHKVGWILTDGTHERIAEELIGFAASSEKRLTMFRRCHRVYHEHFDRSTILDRWDRSLNELLNSH